MTEPRAANAHAVARPMPEDAPVTVTTAPRGSTYGIPPRAVVVCPPSTTRTDPVIHAAAGEQRNSAAPATSSGRPHLPSGMDASVVRRNSGFCLAPAFMSVSIHPGAKALTRTPYAAHSRETVFVRFTMPAF